MNHIRLAKQSTQTKPSSLIKISSPTKICYVMQRVSVSFQVCLKAFTSASMYIQRGYSIKTPHRKAQKNISILEHEQAIFRIFQNKKHHHLAQPTSTLKHNKQKPASTSPVSSFRYKDLLTSLITHALRSCMLKHIAFETQTSLLFCARVICLSGHFLPTNAKPRSVEPSEA